MLSSYHVYSGFFDAVLTMKNILLFILMGISAAFSVTASAKEDPVVTQWGATVEKSDENINGFISIILKKNNEQWVVIPPTKDNLTAVNVDDSMEKLFYDYSGNRVIVKIPRGNYDSKKRGYGCNRNPRIHDPVGCDCLKGLLAEPKSVQGYNTCTSSFRKMNKDPISLLGTGLASIYGSLVGSTSVSYTIDIEEVAKAIANANALEYSMLFALKNADSIYSFNDIYENLATRTDMSVNNLELENVRQELLAKEDRIKEQGRTNLSALKEIAKTHSQINASMAIKVKKAGSHVCTSGVGSNTRYLGRLLSRDVYSNHESINYLISGFTERTEGERIMIRVGNIQYWDQYGNENLAKEFTYDSTFLRPDGIFWDDAKNWRLCKGGNL